MARKSPHLHVIPPEQAIPGPISFDLDHDSPKLSFDEFGPRIENADGSVTFGETSDGDDDADENDFYRNVADAIADEELQKIASDLLAGIEADKQSRKEWMEARATGIRMLGLKLEEPRGDIGVSSAPLEGMSTIRHPILLEAVIHFQANAGGELLPASGPVKVRNDLPMRPDAPKPPPQPPTPGAPPAVQPLGEDEQMDELAAALEKDLNHFLTVTATEYIPDTDRMLFYIGFSGDGFKKVYNCPLRRRPVSESVDAEDIIVSNYATSLRNCSRVTHRIKMAPSWLRRLQIDGHYRDFKLPSPNYPTETTTVERAKAEAFGTRPHPMQPKDNDYEVFEVYCELDLDKFAPKQFKGKSLPLPFVVTIEKESRQVLAVRRNWDEDDDQSLAKQFFVQFPFIRGLGFYGIGLGHILGNVTMALTAIWRIMIDNGMFSSFPGFLIAKGAGRQNINTLRVPPGGAFPVDVPPGMKLSEAFMGLPYRDTGTVFANLAQHIEEVGQRLGQTADINIGEGKQDVPVGTTMALIEQATKIVDSVHKRLHAAQAEEFGLLKERFREDPEAFWRHNKKPARQWTKEQFKEALEERELVPVADPNNPTSLHRIAKATIIDMLATKYPLDIDRRNALRRILRIAGIDADGLMNAQPNQPPPDPRMEAIKAKSQAESMQTQIDQAKLYLDQQKAQAQFADSAAERAFKERMQQFEMQLEQLRVQAEMIIHAHDLKRDGEESQAKIQQGHAETVMGIAQDQAEHQHEMQQDREKHQQDIQLQREKNAMDIQMQREKNDMQLQVEQQKMQHQAAAQQQQHAQQMEQDKQQHEVKLENDKKMGEAKAKAVGPTEKARGGRETEKHQQQLKMNDQKMKLTAEKHKSELETSKKLTDAKVKAMNKPKPTEKK